MSIKIVGQKWRADYSPSLPLERQLKNARSIEIDYSPDHKDLEFFLDEIERLCASGYTPSVNIKFSHNDHIKGAKLKNKLNSLARDIEINELIGKMVTSFSLVDKKLEEIASCCEGREDV